MAELAPAAEPVPIGDEPIKPASADAPASEPTGWMSNTGEFRDGTPEQIQSLLEKKQWTNVEQLATAYQELEKFKGGGNSLVIPEAEDADGWNDIYKTLGRPEEADAYEYERGEDSPVDDALMGEFKKFAHDIGCTQKQFKDIIDFQVDAITAQSDVYQQQIQEKAEADDARVKQMYGINYDAAMQDANNAAEKHGFVEELTAEGIMNIPVVKMMLNTIANMEAEDKIPTDQSIPQQKTPTQRREEIMKSEAFTSKFHPDHKKVMAEYMQLNIQIANSGGAHANR